MILRNQANVPFTNEETEIQNGLVSWSRLHRFVVELVLEFRPSEFKPIQPSTPLCIWLSGSDLHLFGCVRLHPYAWLWMHKPLCIFRGQVSNHCGLPGMSCFCTQSQAATVGHPKCLWVNPAL